LISFAIISLSPKRGADGITSLIGKFRTLLLVIRPGSSLQIWGANAQGPMT
jgi:hypothetical protein